MLDDGALMVQGLTKSPVHNPQKNDILEFQADGSPVGKPDPKRAGLDLIEQAVKIKMQR